MKAATFLNQFIQFTIKSNAMKKHLYFNSKKRASDPGDEEEEDETADEEDDA